VARPDGSTCKFSKPTAIDLPFSDVLLGSGVSTGFLAKGRLFSERGSLLVPAVTSMVAMPEKGALRVLYLILVSVMETPAGPEAISTLTGSGGFVIGTRGGICTAESGGGAVIVVEEMWDCAGTVVGGMETVAEGIGRGRIGLGMAEMGLMVESANGVGETKGTD
jgi:hypothetical protein